MATSDASETRVRVAAFEELSTDLLYQILRLRVDVFVVEQRCPYPDLDGRDTDPTTRHVWAERDGAVLGYLRIVVEPDGTPRIGRVCVVPQARGAGLASRLLRTALDLIADRPVVLHAQAHLTEYYGRFGFTVAGPTYLEDGIPHVMMRRVPTPAR